MIIALPEVITLGRAYFIYIMTKVFLNTHYGGESSLR